MAVRIRDLDLEELTGLSIKVRDQKKLSTKTTKDHAPLQVLQQRKNCKHKMRFKEYVDAEQALERYLSRIMFSSMGIYWCHKHVCYHLGHNRRLVDDSIVLRELDIVQREIG